ncbi:hypothetical protein ACQJBY_071767 [Aegilops geniculata]
MLVVGSTVLDDLPEWLVVDEILVRLPVKDVLRCRAVRKSWHSSTSTDAFILGHHRRQHSLPIIKPLKDICRVVGASNDLTIQPVLRCAILHRATCDGLLILSRQSHYYICNPATHKWASMPHPPQRQPNTMAVSLAGFYRHHPSGEHRVLWVSYPTHDAARGDVAVELLEYFVLTVGSDQPRCIQWPAVSEERFVPTIWSYHCPPILHRGNLHWLTDFNITVFDTIAETFRQMSRPAQLGDYVSLLDTGNTLALCRTDHNCVTLDVWVLQDYDVEMWIFQYQINLLVMEASPPLNLKGIEIPKMAMINERELLIEQCPRRLLHCDIDGVLLGNVESKEHGNFLTLTRHRLQESMISLPLFETQKEAMKKEPPFAFVL